MRTCEACSLVEQRNVGHSPIILEGMFVRYCKSKTRLVLGAQQ